jgi:hypothetical protein
MRVDTHGCSRGWLRNGRHGVAGPCEDDRLWVGSSRLRLAAGSTAIMSHEQRDSGAAKFKVRHWTGRAALGGAWLRGWP